MTTLSGFMFLVLLSACDGKRESSAEMNADLGKQRPTLVTVKNNNPSKSAKMEDVVDIKADWRPDGSVSVNFTIQGNQYHSDLRESKFNMSDIPIRLPGSDVKHEQEVLSKLRTLKFMEDKTSGLSLAFTVDNGKLAPIPEHGVMRHGNSHISFKRNSTDDTIRTFKMPTKKPGSQRISLANRTRGHNREKRSDSLPYGIQLVTGTVELVWIIDYSIVKSFTDLNTADLSQLIDATDAGTILAYYAHLTSIMDDFFATMNNDYVKVRVDLAGMVLIEYSWIWTDLIEDHVLYGDTIDGSDALVRLSEWLVSSTGKSSIPPYDHVMLSTAYDVIEGSGVAYPGSICEQEMSSSIVEGIKPMGANAVIATMMLAFSLGANPDGSDGSSSCPSYNDYILADTGSLDYQFLFSCCSQRAIYSNIHRNGECLQWSTRDRNYHYSFDDSVDDYYPGQVFTADDQCYIAHGTEACGDWVYTQTGKTMCGSLYCVSPSDSSYCTTYNNAAADGTTCDFFTLKWCMQGECIYKTGSRSDTSRSCYVGDCYGNERSCSFGVNNYSPEMFRCYDGTSLECDAVEDCSDGSDEAYCSYTPTRYCSSGYFACTTGISESPAYNRYCIYESWTCDGKADCTDGSDEGPDASCSLTTPLYIQGGCPSGYFSCTTGDVKSYYQSYDVDDHCLKFEDLCDRTTHCDDGSDEENCEERSDCYICSDSSLCVISRSECRTHCQYDNDCESSVAGKSGAGHLIAVIHLYMFFFSIVLFN